MISLLRGKITKNGIGDVIVDVNGVGYGVNVPLSTFYRLPQNGSEVELRIYTQIKENSLELYGFITQREKEIFVRLIGVSGIGPKGAVNILSNIEPEDFVNSVITGDLAKRKVPGIGTKTANKIVMELKDKLTSDSADGNKPGSASLAEDVISALSNLGFTRAEIDMKFDELEEIINNSQGSEDAFKECLKIMKRG